MYTKAIYVIVDSLAIIVMLITMHALGRIKEAYGKWLRFAMLFGIFAITANIFVAVSVSETMAAFSYCAYFSSIDWVILFLFGFCVLYTNHDVIYKKTRHFFAVLMLFDTISIFLNFLFNHQFYIYTAQNEYGVTFFKTGFYSFYYLHLALDYLLILLSLILIIYRIKKSYSVYRIKYLLILFVLIFVILLNLAYMAFSLALDASVVFYGVAGVLIFFSITIFEPRSLMLISVTRAVDDMNEGLLLFDITDTCIYANSFAKERFSMDVSDFSFSSEPISSILKSMGKTGHVYGDVSFNQKVLKGKKEINVYYRVKYCPLLDRRDRHIGSYFLFEDTTEETRYLDALTEARTNADKANQAKSAFLANMSHEIRTPLNSVLGLNEMILRNSEDKEIIDYANNIKQSGAVLLSLINDILDFSKIEANKMEVINVEYNLHALLRDIKQYFEQLSLEKNLYVNISCDENLPTTLYGDEKHIRQVLSNITSNAVKYTKEGGVSISVRSKRRTDKKLVLVFDISDTGIGIADEDLKHIFDAFRRVNEAQNATIQGTGLGLTITKELIGLLKGTINVSSKQNVGTTFTIEIPQEIADNTPIGSFVYKPVTQSTPYKESFHAPNANILVVDDVMVNLKVVEALLKRTLLKIDKATGGEEAIAMCKEKKYDVILLDHRMPAPDGIETFKVISKEGLNTDTPTIALTANALSGAREEYKEIGFTDYLSKPIKSDVLEELLIKYLPKEKVELT